MIITIEKLTDADVTAVQNITLADEQNKFASTAEAFLKDGSETMQLHIIKCDAAVVGFFKIDIAYASKHEFCPDGGIGLRTFAIDLNHQGKGLGSRAVKALFPYLSANYDAYDAIYLTVNCKNPGAKKCYLKGGFVDTGKQYYGGKIGPQYIMSGKIAA